MDAGLFNRKITIEQQTVGSDEFGANAAPTWSTVATCWARVQPQGGNESVQADKRQSQSNTIFTIYFRSGVTNTCRISYGGNYYNVVSIEELGYRKHLQIIGELNK